MSRSWTARPLTSSLPLPPVPLNSLYTQSVWVLLLLFFPLSPTIVPSYSIAARERNTCACGVKLVADTKPHDWSRNFTVRDQINPPVRWCSDRPKSHVSKAKAIMITDFRMEKALSSTESFTIHGIAIDIINSFQFLTCILGQELEAVLYPFTSLEETGPSQKRKTEKKSWISS